MDVNGEFLFQFSMIYNILVPGIDIWFKICFVKQVKWEWPRNKGKITSHRNSRLRFFKIPPDVLRGLLFKYSKILEVWLPWVVILLKANIAKQRIWDKLCNNAQMRLYRNLKLRSSERIWNIISFIITSLAARGNHLVKTW